MLDPLLLHDIQQLNGKANLVLQENAALYKKINVISQENMALKSKVNGAKEANATRREKATTNGMDIEECGTCLQLGLPKQDNPDTSSGGSKLLGKLLLN